MPKFWGFTIYMQHQVIFFCDLKSFLLHLATHECLDFQKERKESCKFKRDKVSPKHKLHHTCRTNHIPQCAGATRAARCSYTGKLGKARVVRVLYPGCAHTNSFKGSHLHPEWVSLDPTEQMCIAVVPPRIQLVLVCLLAGITTQSPGITETKLTSFTLAPT